MKWKVLVPSTRTLQEVMKEIQGIITNTHWMETRRQQLKDKGYLTENCWVKNGEIGTIWYMKRKKVYRIQVSASELQGDWDKAFCVVIPFDELVVQKSELKKMRNYHEVDSLGFPA